MPSFLKVISVLLLTEIISKDIKGDDNFSSFQFQGLHSTYAYCDKHGIPYKKCGKLVVATNKLEVDRLHSLFERAKQNGVPEIELLKGEDAIKKVEPYCRGLEALWSPHTGS